MATKPTDKVVLAEMKLNIEYIKSDVKEIKRKMEDDYVTQEEFKPIRNLAYGLVSIILTGVLGALIALVIKQ